MSDAPQVVHLVSWDHLLSLNPVIWLARHGTCHRHARISGIQTCDHKSGPSGTLVRPCRRQGRLNHQKAAGGRRFPERGFLPGTACRLAYSQTRLRPGAVPGWERARGGKAHKRRAPRKALEQCGGKAHQRRAPQKAPTEKINRPI